MSSANSKRDTGLEGPLQVGRNGQGRLPWLGSEGTITGAEGEGLGAICDGDLSEKCGCSSRGLRPPNIFHTWTVDSMTVASFVLPAGPV